MLTLTIKRVCARDKKGLRSRWKTQKLVKRNEEMAIWGIAFCDIRLKNSVFRCVLLALRRLCVCRACLFLVWKGLLCCPRRQMVCRSSLRCLPAFSIVCFFAIHDEGRPATCRKRRGSFFYFAKKEWSLWSVNEAWGLIRRDFRWLMQTGRKPVCTAAWAMNLSAAPASHIVDQKNDNLLRWGGCRW